VVQVSISERAGGLVVCSVQNICLASSLKPLVLSSGKTTFVNTLCESEVIGHKISDNPETAHIEEGIRIKPVNVELDEDGMRIGLTIVDTPGFGENIDNEYAFQEIVGFLERQYDDILAEESRIKRNPRFRDNRVHALLYFITPTGHSLRELDIELMRRLSPRVNVIPVIGKADSMTHAERADFKKRVSVASGPLRLGASLHWSLTSILSFCLFPLSGHGGH
jgi:septin family protein